MREKRRSNSATRAFWVALVVGVCCPLAEAGERWSRQLTEFTGGPVSGNDWIPLSRPGSERQSGARVLNYFTAPQQPSFLDNTAQPQQHHFTFLNHQFPQSNRFLLQQPPQQELLEQNQPFQLGSFRSGSPPFVGQTIQHPPPPPPPPPPSSTNPFEQQFLSKSPLSEALIQEDNKQPGSPHDQQSFSYQHIRQQEPQSAGGHPPSGGAVSQEEVQLLYVPVETLYNQNQKQELNRFNSLPQPVSPSIINDFYTSAATTTTTPKPPPPRTSAATFPPSSSRFPTSSSLDSSVSRSSLSPSPKPKPNQPPLALFLYNDDPRQSKLSTNEALGGLKNINEIAVLDSVGKNSPKVFIGPSGLAPPKSYSRFDLPYLSSVDLSSNRSNRKIEDLPFFVAPLSYKTPSGYTKISLPPPHVGSIVVRQSSSSNSLENGPFYTRPTAQSNVQYYTPSTLNFADTTTTKAPSITLGSSGKPIYDADHYTSPTGKPTSSNDRSVPQYTSGFNGPPPSRHAVNEEYFNLAKTRKPTTTPPTTPNYPVRSYGSTRQFDFKPMPNQKIPPSFYPVEEDEPEPATTTTFGTTTTTERPTTAQLHFEAERMRTHFREENFRSRRPYQQQTTAASPNEAVETPSQQGHFVHKFKLVDSVKPTAPTRPSSTSVVDNGFLDFFSRSPQQQQHEDEMIKTTITTNLPGDADRQVIRNNYYQAAAAINEDSGANRPKFVSTYYSPSSTAAATTPATLTTQDLFFREFEQKSKFYEREPKYENPSYPTTVGTTGASYRNKYTYETDSSFNESPRYSVEVITTSEPTTVTVDPSQGTTGQQQYSIPSELPPISANLPGLVNALMDDQWPLKTGDRQATPATTSTSSSSNTRAPHFRKQLHRTTTQDSYDIEQATTTRRPVQRGRRPHPSRTTTSPPTGAGAPNEQSSSSTRAPISRSRSRYVPNNEERAASRGRSRSRSTTPRGPLKEVENLDYQRDVLKQNYPVIRPQSQSLPVTTTPASTTTSATTPSTTLNFREVYEDQTERLLATTLANEPPLEADLQQVTRKYSEYYEPEAVVTTVLPPQTTNYFVPSVSSQRAQQPEDYSSARGGQEEYIRSQEVIPLARDPEQSVIPLRSQNVATEAPVAPPQYQPVTESEEKLTTAYGQPVDEPMELKKVEITPRPRRPGLVSRQRDPQQNYYSRTTTEQTTTVRTTTPEPAAVGSRTSGRRPAFVRRPSRLYATTTVAPTSPTTPAGNNYDQQQSTQGTYTVRTKNRQDILRGRTRRPTTTTEPTVAATTASPEAPVTRAFGRGNSLRRISPTARSRQQEQTAAPTTTQQPAPASSSGPRFRIRERTRFNLQPQESQWSTKLNQNSFQPVLKTEGRGVGDLEQENVSTEPEPEIVTAAREAEMYFMNVSSNYGQKEGTQQETQTEDSTENSVPSFADLLNDVMKDFIDDNSQKKTVTDEKQRQTSDVDQRRPVNFRNNFLRKRGRSKVVDSFETAESQHINHAAQVYNGQAPHYGESVKQIDQAILSGKNASPKTVSKLHHEEEVENTAQEESTLAPQEDGSKHETETEETDSEDLVTVLPSVENASTTVGPLSDSVSTTSKPTEEVPTLASLEQTSTNPPPQQDRAEVTTVSAVTVEPAFEEELTDSSEEKKDNDKTPPASSSFEQVKKMVSDYYKVVENDSETEEVVDGDTPPGEVDDVIEEEGDFFRATDEPSSENDELAPTTDMTPSETLFVPVTADPPAVNPMGSLVIPTSVSNGITHETEICYRGRCIKTEDDKRKRKDKLN
ncbi:AGAP007645-PA-like protein [Anopheles sinensis]|uniref:AGAP007645-PA-like protein n=1 Tax=Anopheles sinensis TaxID=74873 RepID=A0A084VFA8_ANOSI|nr:AGAP007645-PA-like protein [Anopheles sinensis]